MLTKRNGKIEILRFVFCIGVLLFHAGNDVLGNNCVINPYFSFFSKGRIGVEFFFLISGFLAAKSACKIRNTEGSVGYKTFDFILRKIKTILPYHIIAVILAIIMLYLYSDNFIIEFANRIPGAFFLQRTGISNYDLISVEWYICSMLLALVIIYPLLLKNFDFTALVFAPTASSVLIGYLVKTYGAMPPTYVYEKYTYACNIRGFAVVLLGCFCFAISEKIKSADLSHLSKFVLIIAENICWIVAVYYMISNINIRYESYVIYFMAFGVTLTFGRNINNGVYNNRLVFFLGKLSLPIYLCQNAARSIVKNELEFLSDKMSLLLITVLAVLFGILSYLICEKTKVFNRIPQTVK